MNDRSEKIVSLAREMLQSEFMREAPQTTQPQTLALSMKTYFLAAFLAAFGSAFATHSIDQARRPLTRVERVELDALVFYASRLKAMKEENLRYDMLGKLARQSMDDLTYADFKRARDYLQSRLR